VHRHFFPCCKTEYEFILRFSPRWWNGWPDAWIVCRKVSGWVLWTANGASLLAWYQGFGSLAGAIIMAACLGIVGAFMGLSDGRLSGTTKVLTQTMIHSPSTLAWASLFIMISIIIMFYAWINHESIVIIFYAYFHNYWNLYNIELILLSSWSFIMTYQKFFNYITYHKPNYY